MKDLTLWHETIEDDGSVTMSRIMVMSTKDYMFRNRKNYVTDWSGDVKSEMAIPDNQVICNGCNKNMYPELCYGMEYTSGSTDNEWVLYDVYCEPCVDSFWPDMPKVTRDELHDSEKYK